MRSEGFIPTILIFILVWAPWASASQAFDAAVSQAKTFMGQGQRKQALDQLAIAQGIAKGKKEQHEVAAKRKLFAEQFITSQSFQTYQEAKAFSDVNRWAECVSALDSIPPSDQDNTQILKIRGDCQRRQVRLDLALKAYQAVLDELPGDFEASISIADIDFEQKEYAQGLTLIQNLQPTKSDEIENYVILKAKFLANMDRSSEAIELLRQDQESHLDHVRVSYELGSMYANMPKNEWQARKYLSLFLLRCKRMDDDELKKRGLDTLVQKAHATLSEVNKRLKV